MTTFRFSRRCFSIRIVYALYKLYLLYVLAVEVIKEPISLWLGQKLSFIKTISEVEGDTAHFSFFTPRIDTSSTYVSLAAIFKIVINKKVMTTPVTNPLTPSQIILSMSTMDVTFFEYHLDILQFLKIVRPENGTFIRKEF